MQTLFIERLVQEEDNWVWKPFPEQLDIENDFQLDESNLNYELCRLGQLLARYGQLAAEQSTNLQRKEAYVKLVKAKVAGALRSEAEQKGKKMTENALEEKVIISDLYQQALQELHILRADAIKVENWYRSLIKKADLITALVYKQNAELRKMPG